jgi:hypothetical protein
MVREGESADRVRDLPHAAAVGRHEDVERAAVRTELDIAAA